MLVLKNFYNMVTKMIDCADVKVQVQSQVGLKLKVRPHGPAHQYLNIQVLEMGRI